LAANIAKRFPEKNGFSVIFILPAVMAEITRGSKALQN